MLFCGHLHKGSRISNVSSAQVFNTFDKVSAAELCLESLSTSPEIILISSFIFTCLMVSASKMPKYLYVSFFPERSNIVLI